MSVKLQQTSFVSFKTIFVAAGAS